MPTEDRGALLQNGKEQRRSRLLGVTRAGGRLPVPSPRAPAQPHTEASPDGPCGPQTAVTPSWTQLPETVVKKAELTRAGRVPPRRRLLRPSRCGVAAAETAWGGPTSAVYRASPGLLSSQQTGEGREKPAAL